MARRFAACRPIRAAALTHLFIRCGVPAALIASTTSACADCEATVIETPALVAFEGCIDQQSARLLIRALDRHPTSALLVKSSGGDVNAAVEAATVMALLRTRLIIRGQCLSSCANYWLPAAASVDVEEGSVIGFHGDARTTFGHDPLPPSLGAEAQYGMALVLEQEADLGKAVPKVDDLHALQAIRRSKEPLRVHLHGHWQWCPGLALPAVWAPTLARLQALGIVSRVIPRAHAFEPRIAFGHDIHPMTAADDDADPAARCVCTDAP